MKSKPVTKLLKHTSCIGVLLACATSAQAGLIGVKTLRIDGLLSEFLQVTEVIATQTGTGTDLALASLGATVTGSPTLGPLSQFGPAHAIDGDSHPSPYNIFHSAGGGAFLLVELADAFELDSVTLFGRWDCCSDRDIYSLSLLNAGGDVLFSASDLSANNPLHSVTVNLASSAIPNPATVWLFGLGLFGLIGVARGKKAA
jgi:hypothetical protein